MTLQPWLTTYDPDAVCNDGSPAGAQLALSAARLLMCGTSRGRAFTRALAGYYYLAGDPNLWLFYLEVRGCFQTGMFLLEG